MSGEVVMKLGFGLITNKVGGTQKLGSKLISLSHKRFFDDPTEKRIVDGEITPKSEYYLGWE